MSTKKGPTSSPEAWETRPERRIAVVGFTETKHEAPWSDAAWECWGMNNLHLSLPEETWKRASRWYNLHDAATIEKDQPHVDWLRAGHMPVVVWDTKEEWPTSVEYPKAEMIERFGRYFTNSVSWMLAHAIYEGATEIGVYGVDMAQSSEYCIGPETLVLTDDLRWVTAAKVAEGDVLLAFDEEPAGKGRGGNPGRRFRRSRVLSAERVTLPSAEVVLSDGTRLVCSWEHRWLSYEQKRHKWRRTSDLLTGDHRSDGRPSRLIRLLDTWETDESRDAGYLAASFDGEGSITLPTAGDGSDSGSLVLTFAQRDNAMARAVDGMLASRGFDASRHTDKRGCIKYAVRGGREEILRFLGAVRPLRLLEGFDGDRLGCLQSTSTPDVVSVTDVGATELIALKTETGTFIADGIASHNSSQRPSCEYFLGLAAGLGIALTIPQTSDLLKAASLYGAESDGGLALKLAARSDELQARLQEMENQHSQVMAGIHQLRGALESNDYIRGVWMQPSIADRSTAVADPNLS